jgi:hypothetical protein
MVETPSPPLFAPPPNIVTIFPDGSLAIFPLAAGVKARRRCSEFHQRVRHGREAILLRSARWESRRLFLQKLKTSI